MGKRRVQWLSWVPLSNMQPSLNSSVREFSGTRKLPSNCWRKNKWDSLLNTYLPGFSISTLVCRSLPSLLIDQDKGRIGCLKPRRWSSAFLATMDLGTVKCIVPWSILARREQMSRKREAIRGIDEAQTKSLLTGSCLASIHLESESWRKEESTRFEVRWLLSFFFPPLAFKSVKSDYYLI